jgi:hypothetical protein
MAAIGGGVGAGLGTISGLSGSLGADVLRGALGNAITQGIGVATGLQRRFDWAGVAAAGVMAGVTGLVSRNIPGAATSGSAATFGNQFISGMAGMIAGAATRSIVNGSDFGDNIMAMLPDAIGQTIGNMVTGSIEQCMTTATAIQPEPGEEGGQFASLRISASAHGPISDLPAGASADALDGFRLRFGDDADRSAVTAKSETDIRYLLAALQNARPADVPRLYDDLLRAMSHYELAAGPGSLRATLLVPDTNELKVAEAWARGANDLARDFQARAGATGTQITRFLNHFRNSEAGEAFGHYLDNTITIASLDEISIMVADGDERRNIVRTLGAGRGDYKRQIEGTLYPLGIFQSPISLTDTPFFALNNDLEAASIYNIPSADKDALNAGLAESAGRYTYTGLLSLATGGVIGAIGLAYRPATRLTLAILDKDGRYLGAHNAGPNTPVFKNWLAQADASIEIFPSGAIRYTKSIDGKLVSVNYKDGYPDFSPFTTHPSGVTSVEIVMTGKPSDYRAANLAARRPEWGESAPKNWSWHHVQDMKTMQLIPRNINAGFPHAGGASLVRRRQ